MTRFFDLFFLSKLAMITKGPSSAISEALKEDEEDEDLDFVEDDSFDSSSSFSEFDRFP